MTVSATPVPRQLVCARCGAAFACGSTVGMFKVMPKGEAVRIQVKLGRSSVNTIEILDGLREGEQAVLSDMSAWDAYDRVKLN